MGITAGQDCFLSQSCEPTMEMTTFAKFISSERLSATTPLWKMSQRKGILSVCLWSCVSQQRAWLWNQEAALFEFNSNSLTDDCLSLYHTLSNYAPWPSLVMVDVQHNCGRSTAQEQHCATVVKLISQHLHQGGAAGGDTHTGLGGRGGVFAWCSHRSCDQDSCCH